MREVEIDFEVNLLYTLQHRNESTGVRNSCLTFKLARHSDVNILPVSTLSLSEIFLFKIMQYKTGTRIHAPFNKCTVVTQQTIDYI